MLETAVTFALFAAVWAVSSLVGRVFGGLGELLASLGSVAALALVLVSRIGGEGELGQSYGRHLAGIKVVSERDGRPIGWPAALGRRIIRWFGGYMFGLGQLWILWDPQRQGWHDKAVGSLVVKDHDAPKLDPVAYVRAIFGT